MLAPEKQIDIKYEKQIETPNEIFLIQGKYQTRFYYQIS